MQLSLVVSNGYWMNKRLQVVVMTCCSLVDCMQLN